MKGKTDDFSRINHVLQGDKSVMSDGCKMLVLQDFERKFNEYFDVLTPPKMDIIFSGGVYQVRVTFEAERVKKFNVLK